MRMGQSPSSPFVQGTDARVTVSRRSAVLRHKVSDLLEIIDRPATPRTAVGRDISPEGVSRWPNNRDMMSRPWLAAQKSGPWVFYPSMIVLLV